MSQLQYTRNYMSSSSRLAECFKDTLNQIAQDEIIKSLTSYTIENTVVYDEGFSSSSGLENENTAEIIVEEGTSLRIAKKYMDMLKSDEKRVSRLAVLNFANPHNPGGGVKNGAMAQEECLCRSSNLYASLTTREALEKYYGRNKMEAGVLFSDRLIYSPDVTVFKLDDEFPRMLPQEQWFQVDVITCAAPYVKQLADVDEKNLLKLLEKRIHNIFEVARYNKAEVLILGAFGCGAFGNPPKLVAKAFHNVIELYKKHFKKIVFAIKSTVNDFPEEGCPNLAAFKAEFYEKSLSKTVVNEKIQKKGKLQWWHILLICIGGAGLLLVVLLVVGSLTKRDETSDKVVHVKRESTTTVEIKTTTVETKITETSTIVSTTQKTEVPTESSTEAQTKPQTEPLTQPATQPTTEVPQTTMSNVDVAASTNQSLENRLLEKALDYYEKTEGHRPRGAMLDSISGDTAIISLYDKDESKITTLDWYTVDINTGRGENFWGSEIAIFE